MFTFALCLSINMNPFLRNRQRDDEIKNEQMMRNILQVMDDWKIIFPTSNYDRYVYFRLDSTHD